MEKRPKVNKKPATKKPQTNDPNTNRFLMPTGADSGIVWDDPKIQKAWDSVGKEDPKNS